VFFKADLLMVYNEWFLAVHLILLRRYT